MQKKQATTAALMLVAGIAIGAGLSGLGWLDAEGEKEVLYWVAPMDPNYRSDKPGKSPMGMDLVPVYEDEAAMAGSSVRIDPTVSTNIGLRIATVELASLSVPVRTVGRITYDEERLVHIHLRSDGWIEQLAVKAVGEPVKRGELLFSVYSPELVNAQAEFLQALASGQKSLIGASRARLGALDISERQIAGLERTRRLSQYVEFFAPIDGVITKLNAADGMFVKPTSEIMEIAELSPVWLIADVFESDVARLGLDAEIKATSAYDPGSAITGKVDYIYPDLDPVTRTVPVRAVVDNPEGLLKPGMFMSVEIAGAPRPETAVIPSEALIRTGREERVIVRLEDNHFRPAKVVSGLEAGGRVEILAGLAVGETVVTSGQFLIDSESSLAGAELRLSPPGMKEKPEKMQDMDRQEMDQDPKMNHEEMDQRKGMDDPEMDQGK